MNDHLEKLKSLVKPPLAVILLFIFIFFASTIYSQDTILKPFPINLTDTLDFNEQGKGFLKKVLQTIKFKENRNLKEQQRIYQFILKLIEKKDLNIDLNINEIAKVLASIEKADSLKFASIKSNVIKNKRKIDSLLAREKEYADSLKIKSATLRIHSLDAIKNKKKAISTAKQEKNDSLLKIIKSVKYTCKSIKIGESTDYEFCLEPKTKIIGWHDTLSKGKFKNYNFNYLSVLNLYAYELDINGRPKNKEKIDEFKEPKGVIEFAQTKGTDVHLTVFNEKSKEIVKFLKDFDAQTTLIKNVSNLIEENGINGINIYFPSIEKREVNLFSLFIKKLHENLDKYQTELNITIPAIYDDISLENVSAYNFTELNQFVDYYLVTTDKMTKLDNSWAQPASPLKSLEESEFGTINSTVNFYSNGKIPLNKLIISVSYLGIEWPVIDFKDRKVNKNYKPNEIQYNEIVNSYKNNKDFKQKLKQEFDPIKAATFLNITRRVADFYEPKYTQIWYENSNSLKIKYNWVLERKLGGVSIRGLGYDDGYTDLWDALGSTLIDTKPTLIKAKAEKTKECTFKLFEEVESIKQTYINQKIKRDRTSNDSLKLSYKAWISQIYLRLHKIFNENKIEEEKLSSLDSIDNHMDSIENRIDSILEKYINTNIFKKGNITGRWSNFDSIPKDPALIENKRLIWYKFQWYSYDQDTENKKNKVFKFLGLYDLFEKWALYSDYKWASEPKTNYLTAHEKLGKNDNLLNKNLEDKESCFCLYKRLIIFSKISFYAAGLCLMILLVLISITNYRDRFNITGKLEHKIIKYVSLFFGISATILIFYGLFITPYFQEFGASNQGAISLELILIILFTGIILGLYVYSRYAKGKYLRKDLP
jgi:spore germination protein YaaH